MVNSSYNPLDDYAFISSHFKNEAIFVSQKDAAVYLEGEDDIFFWEPVFAYALPKFKCEFYYNSNLQATREIEHRSGSGECQKFYPHTDRQFLVCIDSDYKYLINSHTFVENSFVFQTYTYSIENHYCYISNLDAVAARLTNSFNFDSFLKKYSKIIYELFVFSVLSLKKEDGIFPIKQFETILKIVHPIDLSGDGINKLNRLRPIVDAKVLQLKSDYSGNGTELNQLKVTLQNKGLTPETTYLFIKGHSLIDLEKINRPKIINSINR